MALCAEGEGKKMEKVIVIEHAKTLLNREEVLRQVDCYEGSPIYEEVIEEYEQIREQILQMCTPVILFQFGEIEESLVSEKVPFGSQVVYALYSVGGKISRYSTKAFEQGDYLKGMLADAMADCLLFSMQREVDGLLRQECARRHMGISGRLEAPQDIPMVAQKVIHRRTQAQELKGIEISSGYMFDPVKSNGIIYLLTEDERVFKSQHDCRRCNRVDCKMRKIPDTEVIVKERDKTYTLMLKERRSILEGLLEHGTYLSAVCGGKGSCGKCKIRLLEGELGVTESDKKVFSQRELDMGYRLSCKAYPSERVVIEAAFQSEEEFEILSAYGSAEEGRSLADEEAVIAIDIGTTTIALQLLGKNSARVMNTYAAINRQRAYGADVISRIKASSEGKREELKKSIREDLTQGIRHLVEGSKIDKGLVKEIAIAGNTTMGHLLMGYDCQGLGVYPFTPVNIGRIEGRYSEILADDYLDVSVTILPGISTYVGGDITAGMLRCGFDRRDKCAVLIDLGTNGEMAMGKKDKILVTSTAAGPAFEGGNIQWGMGSVPGAISGVQIENGKAVLRTIGDKLPIGLCGTGVIETVAELVKGGLVDDSGLLDEDYFEEGYPLARTEQGETIVFTQKDVREIQLAKSAVRAGLETLILRYGVPREKIETVYLAGGFGFKLDIAKAIAIGMLPEEFSDRIKTVGNSSLGGAAEFLTDPRGRDRIEEIVQVSREVNLSSDKEFNEFYMDAMFFEAD